MCLIVYKPAGVSLVWKDFESAVINNPDGYGFCLPDGNGRLYTERDVDPNGTDAAALYDKLHGELFDDPVLLHLRYTTAGETILRNAHPFPVLEKKDDGSGVDIRLMHNGTLSAYKPDSKADNSWESDSRLFTRFFVRPLMERMAMAMPADKLINDPLIDVILESQLTSMSVVAMMDGFGNVSVVNEKGNGGFWSDDGCYFSNKYSFDPNHRVTSYYSKGNHTTSYPGYKGTVTHYNHGYENSKPKASSNDNTGVNMKDTQREKFSDTHGSMFDIDCFEDLLTITDESIELIASDTEVASSFIREILYHAYTMNQTLAQARKLKKEADQRAARLEGTIFDMGKRIESQSAWITQAKKAGYDGKAA